jgi:hypothetical protein
VHDGALWSFGGVCQDSGNQGSTVIARAPVVATQPTVGPWAFQTATLRVARLDPMVLIKGTFVYVVGGFVAGNESALVDVGPLADAQPLQAGPALPQARRLAATVEHAGHLYVIGGYFANAPRDTVFEASIQPDGSLSPSWRTLTTLPKPLHSVGAFAAAGHLFVVGGELNPQTYAAEVYRAKILPDGSLGEWDATVPRLPVQRKSQAFVVF